MPCGCGTYQGVSGTHPDHRDRPAKNTGAPAQHRFDTEMRARRVALQHGAIRRNEAAHSVIAVATHWNPSSKGAHQWRYCFEEIRFQPEVRDAEDRGIRFLVDLAVLHARQVLDGAADAARDVQLGGDDLACLAHLEIVGRVAGITAVRLAPIAAPSLSASGASTSENFSALPSARPPETTTFADQLAAQKGGAAFQGSHRMLAGHGALQPCSRMASVTKRSPSSGETVAAYDKPPIKRR